MIPTRPPDDPALHGRLRRLGSVLHSICCGARAEFVKLQSRTPTTSRSRRWKRLFRLRPRPVCTARLCGRRERSLRSTTRSTLPSRTGLGNSQMLISSRRSAFTLLSDRQNRQEPVVLTYRPQGKLYPQRLCHGSWFGLREGLDGEPSLGDRLQVRVPDAHHFHLSFLSRPRRPRPSVPLSPNRSRFRTTHMRLPVRLSRRARRAVTRMRRLRTSKTRRRSEELRAGPGIYPDRLSSLRTHRHSSPVWHHFVFSRFTSFRLFPRRESPFG